MARMRIRPGQIQGINQQTLKDDVVDIIDQAKTYEGPVDSKTHLPTEGNIDGMVRMVLDENRFYIWDEPTTTWVPDLDYSTEARTITIPVEFSNQTIFTTPLQIGVPGGIAGIDTIVLSINGMVQSRSKDFSIDVITGPPKKVQIIWKSVDFQLDQDDEVHLNYDELIIN